MRLASSFPFDSTWQRTDKPRITGNYRGTTDEIIQWVRVQVGLVRQRRARRRSSRVTGTNRPRATSRRAPVGTAPAT